MTNINKHKIFILVISTLVMTAFGCDHSVRRDFIATYQIDKVVPIDTSIQTRQKIENTNGWTIYLGDENFFKFKRTNKIIEGVWYFDKIEGNNQFIDFQFNIIHISGRLNGNIIYFDSPNLLLDSLFESALFVKLKDKEL